jgi:hypothetical protein
MAQHGPIWAVYAGRWHKVIMNSDTQCKYAALCSCRVTSDYCHHYLFPAEPAYTASLRL